jgi:subtilisin-like proprotein convertase family protein
VLSRNPDLRWQEVRDVLKRSCERVDLPGGQWGADGHSPRYGFGRLNALTAVELAVPQPADRLFISRVFSEPVRDLQTSQVSVEVGESRKLADLKVQVDIRHSFIGDLVVRLLPPESGTPVTLHNRTGGGADNIRRTYDAVDVPALGVFKGASALGSWSLEVRDEALRDVGGIAGFGLELHFQ